MDVAAMMTSSWWVPRLPLVGGAAMTRDVLDLGLGHTLRFVAFQPDRALNPHLADLPDDDRAGAIVTHPRRDTPGTCESYISLNPALADGRSTWTVESWEPLTLAPSLLCRACGDHGFIRAGRWVTA